MSAGIPNTWVESDAHIFGGDRKWAWSRVSDTLKLLLNPDAASPIEAISVDPSTGAVTFAGGSHGTGTVTSVAATVPAGFAVAGSPITTAGTLAVTYATAQTANRFLATPDGSTGALALRAIVVGDLPAAVKPASTTGAIQYNNAGAFGGDAAKLTWDPTNTILTVQTEGTASIPIIRLSSGAESVPYLQGITSTGTLAAPLVSASGDVGLFVEGDGYDTTNTQRTFAQVGLAVDAAPAGAIVPGRISLKTANATALLERVSVDQNGVTTIASEALDRVNGVVVTPAVTTGVAKIQAGGGASDTNVSLQILAKGTGNILMTLPAADPHVVGALYTTAGAVKVSAG